MHAYVKTAHGETLSYRPDNLQRYAGEQFCLRITPGDIDLDRCFFVYLDERFEGYSLRKLFLNYFLTPGPEQEAEMAAWLEPWLYLDPMLPKKRMLLRQMFNTVRERSGQLLYYINHGPGPVNPEDTVRTHLGTSVFADGSFDDKILDVVLEFHAGATPLHEMEQWARFDPIDTAAAASISTSTARGPATGIRRRSMLAQVGLFLVALVTLPALLFSCRGMRNGNAGGGGGGGVGFGGGML